MPWQPVDPRTYASSVTAPIPHRGEVFRRPGYTQPPQPKNPMATTALVLGIIGIVILPLALPAIVFGHLGASSSRRVGRSVARAGYGLGYLSILAWSVTILIASGVLFL